MTNLLRLLALFCLGPALGLATPTARGQGFDFSGAHPVLLHPREGPPQRIGTVSFGPAPDGRVAFKLALDHAGFKDYFLSMREFKCLDGATELLCHVPYPYPQPGTVAPDQLAWLEHSLMFMFKSPKDFGAKLWNGVYYQLKPVGSTLVGSPQAVDLNRIGAPPARTDLPPFKPAWRDDMSPDARWFNKLTIE